MPVDVFLFPRRDAQLSRWFQVFSTALTLSVLISVQERDRTARHNCRDGVFVDKLRMAITPQENAEIIEPGDDSLQLYAINEEDREWCLVFANVIEKGVL